MCVIYLLSLLGIERIGKSIDNEGMSIIVNVVLSWWYIWVLLFFILEKRKNFLLRFEVIVSELWWRW